jgi:hypothetical protein
MRNLIRVAAALLANCAAGVALAQSVQTSAQNAQFGPDPNEIVCERQQVIGSRLAKQRICMTRAQWQDARRQDRQAIEKMQTQRGLSGGG